MKEDFFVTAESDDSAILNAINTAGARAPRWRKHDKPSVGDANQLSWVIPRDIGKSDSNDRSLLRRLHKMTKNGLLEVRYLNRRRRIWRENGLSCEHVSHKSMPRFRVIVS